MEESEIDNFPDIEANDPLAIRTFVSSWTCGIGREMLMWTNHMISGSWNNDKGVRIGYTEILVDVPEWTEAENGWFWLWVASIWVIIFLMLCNPSADRPLTVVSFYVEVFSGKSEKWAYALPVPLLPSHPLGGLPCNFQHFFPWYVQSSSNSHIFFIFIFIPKISFVFVNSLLWHSNQGCVILLWCIKHDIPSWFLALQRCICLHQCRKWLSSKNPCSDLIITWFRHPKKVKIRSLLIFVLYFIALGAHQLYSHSSWFLADQLWFLHNTQLMIFLLVYFHEPSLPFHILEHHSKPESRIEKQPSIFHGQ